MNDCLNTNRAQLFSDLYNGIIPEKVPIEDNFGLEFYIQQSGMDLMESQYVFDEAVIGKIYDTVLNIIEGDALPLLAYRSPESMMYLKSSSFKMSATGQVQHPENSYMSAEEYDDFISDPNKFILETVQKRINASFGKGEVFRQMAYTAASLNNAQKGALLFAEAKKRAEITGLFLPPAGTSSIAQAPFDYIADFCRGFSRITSDIRRYPEKVLEAVEAVTPFMVWKGMPGKIDFMGAAKFMTHMPSFLNNKQFERFYFPTFLAQIHIYASKGIASKIFLEGDWTRFTDLLTELPGGTRLYMEYGDSKEFKEKLGKKMIIGGLYPLTLLKNSSKDACIDKAKEITDIMAPGGNYFFTFDKIALNKNDVDLNNYKSVTGYINAQCKYDNHGEKSFTVPIETTIKNNYGKYTEFKSEYYPSYEEFTSDYPAVNDKANGLMKAAYENNIVKLIKTAHI